MSDGLGGSSPVDDEMDRRLRELTEGMSGASRIREPSAAEREKAGKKRTKALAREAKTRARASRSEARRSKGRGWQSPPSGSRRRGGQAVAWSVAVVVIAGAALFAWHHESGVGGPDDTQVVKNGALPQTSADAPAAKPLSGPPADPFSGTPADHWADGAAGITIPAAVSHGPFTASEVAAAYATTRRLLIAQNLDQTTLLGGAPTAFADVLRQQQRTEFIAGLDKIGLTKQGYAQSTRIWVASFAPGTTALIGTVIKVHGTMSAHSAVEKGSSLLDIDVNYRFVYAVEPPHAPADWMRVVGQVTGYIEFDNWQDAGGPLQPWDVSAFPAEAGTRCAMTDGFGHPDYPGGPLDKVQPAGAPINPYSMDIPAATGGCRRTTGT
jgi:hypothetical protein